MIFDKSLLSTAVAAAGEVCLCVSRSFSTTPVMTKEWVVRKLIHVEFEKASHTH